LNFLFKIKQNIKSEQFGKLIQVMRNDPEINKRIIQLLKLDSYQRRNVLNRWLEQLRHTSASENLMQALSNLFDDNVAEKVLTLINNHRFLKN
jgi:hypothetical protein